MKLMPPVIIQPDLMDRFIGAVSTTYQKPHKYVLHFSVGPVPGWVFKDTEDERYGMCGFHKRKDEAVHVAQIDCKAQVYSFDSQEELMAWVGQKEDA